MKRLEIVKWEKYNRLSIIKEIDSKKNKRYFLCKCECWIESEVRLENLRWWQVKSCWCLDLERKTKHWHANRWKKRSWIYNSWMCMKQRCDNPNVPFFKNYWWRWIKYERAWSKFENFLKDMWDSFKKWLTIERVNNEWWYSKENCEWITIQEQQKNKRPLTANQ